MYKCKRCGSNVDKEFKIEIRPQPFSPDGKLKWGYLIKKFGESKSIAGGANFGWFYGAELNAREKLADLFIDENNCVFINE